MDEVLERARGLVDRYEEHVRSLLPADAALFDAHVHVGRDIDGMVSPLDELSAFLRRAGVERAFAFCMDEPDREPAFRAANDRTLAAAERSEGLVVPFVRLDLGEQPIEEATRCLDLGARGIKLHPRAQGFLLDDQRLEPVFALAAERRVPILIHGGRGLPPIAENLRRLHDSYPEASLIIAHAGIADLAALSECFSGRPGVYFDTSVWSAIDLLDMLARVAPGQMLYASDYPYGQQPGSLLIALRTALLVGSSEDEIRDMLGRSAARIADDEPPAPLTEPRGPGASSSPWPSPASTATSRWRRRFCGRGRRTRSAFSASRSTPAPSATATATSSRRSPSSSARRATSGARSRRPGTTPRSARSAARRSG